MQIKFRTYRHLSRSVLPVVLVFLIMGFGSGMRICTALLHHDHPMHAHTVSDSEHGNVSHDCDHGESHYPDHQLSCDTCGHLHIRISVHDATRTPQVQARQPGEAPVQLALNRTLSTGVHAARVVDAPLTVLLQNISPIVLLN